MTTPIVADPAVLERVLRETAVARTPGRPGLSDYLTDVAVAIEQWLRRWAPHLDPSWRDFLVRGLSVLALVLLAGLVATIAVVLLRASRTRRRAEGRTTATPRRQAAASPDSERDGPGWAAEMEARLLEGDVRAALEALWWWFARSLGGTRAEASWTSPELLAQAGRRDLTALAATLDRMIYGAACPGPIEVRRLFGQLQEAL